jgi:hypothetical protein
MAATIQVTCTDGTPHGLEWVGRLNSSFHPPDAMVDGRETSLTWGGPTVIELTPGQRHKLEVYFRVSDVLRMCGAEVEVEPMRDGESRPYKYAIELNDPYPNRGLLSHIG